MEKEFSLASYSTNNARMINER